MKIYIKKYLLEEGVVQGVKDNWGTLLMAGIGIAAAHSGALGPKAKLSVDTGGNNIKNFLDTASDRSKTMAEFYKPKVESGMDSAKETLSNTADNLKDKAHDIKDNLPDTMDKLKTGTNNALDSGANKLQTFSDSHHGTLGDTIDNLMGHK